MIRQALGITLIASALHLSLAQAQTPTQVGELPGSPTARCEQALDDVAALRHGLENLGIPVVTVNIFDQSALYPYDQAAALRTTRALISGICGPGSACSDLLSIVELTPGSTSETSRQDHRRKIDSWVATHLPGMRLVWPEEASEVVQGLTRRYRIPQHYQNINSLGTWSDWFYHRAISEGMIPVMNHHDILGHLLAFSVPGVRELTRRQSRVFAEVLQLEVERERADGQAVSDQGIREGLSPFFFYSQMRSIQVDLWNLIQEKLLIWRASSSHQPAEIALLGGLATLFNYFYDPAHRGHALEGNLGGALYPYYSRPKAVSFTINILPHHDPLPDARAQELSERVTRLFQALNTIADRLGVSKFEKATEYQDPGYKLFSDLMQRTLFSHEDAKGFAANPKSMVERVSDLAKGIEADPELTTLLSLEGRIEYWNAVLDVIEAWMAKERYIITHTPELKTQPVDRDWMMY